MAAAAVVVAFQAVGSAVISAGVAIGTSGLVSASVGGAIAGFAAEVGGAIAAFGSAITFGSGLVAGLGAWATTISLATALMGAPVPSSGGTQIATKLDPQAPIPVVMGTTGVGGYLVKRSSRGSDNHYLDLINVLSAGPVKSINQHWANYYALNYDRAPLHANPQATVTGASNADLGKQFKDKLKTVWQFGADNEPSWGSYGVPISGFDATSKMSGYAAVWNQYQFDQDAYPQGSPPASMYEVSGVFAYDPRQDSTFPGGSGTQRLYDHNTWGWTENPIIGGLAFIIGDFRNGVLRWGIGTGTDTSAVDWPSWVYAANIADANSWKMGGSFVSSDDPFSVLNSILQAGSAQLVEGGGPFGVTIDAPKVAVWNITSADVRNKVTINNTTSYRDRKNGIIPSCRLRSQYYNTVAGELIRQSTYLEEDSGIERVIQLQLPFVQDFNQAHQIAAYVLCNTREFLTTEVIVGPRIGLSVEPGQVITLDVPEASNYGSKYLITKSEIDLNSGLTTLSLRSETDSKHAYCLGQSATEPASPALQFYDATNPDEPAEGAWSVTATSISDNGHSVPCLKVDGAVEDPNAALVISLYRKVGDGFFTTWKTGPRSTTEFEITAVTAGTTYEVAIAYQTVLGQISTPRSLGTFTAGQAISQGVSNIPVVISGTDQITYVPNANGGTLVFPVGFQTGDDGMLVNVPDAQQDVSDAANAVANSAELNIQTMLREFDIYNYFNSSYYLGGSDPRTAIVNESNARVASDLATANTFALLGAVVPSTHGSAFRLDIANVLVDANTSVASYVSATSANNSAFTAAISNEANARVTADGALANSIATLQATYNAANTAVYSLITTEATTRASNVAALAQTITNTVALINTVNSTVSAAIQQETTARVNGNSSVVSMISNLQAQLTQANTTLSAGIFNEACARVTADNATSTLISKIGAASGDGSSFILNSGTTISGQGSSIATLLNGLRSDLTTANSTLSAAISSEASARVTANSAISSRVDTVSTTVDGHTSQISQAFTAINGIEGRYFLTVSGAAGITGFDIYNGGAGQYFKVYSENFQIVDGNGSGASPFTVSGGVVTMRNVVINGNLLVNGTIQTPHLADGAASTYGAYQGAQTNVQTQAVCATGSLPSKGGRMRVTVTPSINVTSSRDVTARVYLYRDGNLLKEFDYFIRNTIQDCRSLCYCDNGIYVGNPGYSVQVWTADNLGGQAATATVLLELENFAK